MAKFLEKVADYILENVGQDTLQTAVIFPNRRSEIFLKNYLKKKITSNYWLPEFFTVDEFMVKNSGMVELEAVNVYFELYKIHKQIAGEDARGLDDFLAWAPIMLTDFTDIDLYLGDAEEIFSNLSEARAIEQWNLSGKPLTELQKNYLAFYNSLYQYYSNLRSNLSKQNLGYKGMIYRHLYENIETISNTWNWKRIILVGFNALSEVEKKVFGYLKNHYQVDVLFDVDDYYYSDENPSSKEAGRFIRSLVKEWEIKDINWRTNKLTTDKQKEINILGVPKRIGQVKYASQLIEEWVEDDTIGRKTNEESLMDTAVVLGDEKLLVPFLNSLPQNEDSEGNKLPFNLTMGYPVSNSPVALFVLSWIALLQSNEGTRDEKYAIRHILSLLNNPFFRTTIDISSKNNTQKISKQILDKKSIYLSKNEILAMVVDDSTNTSNLFDIILKKPKEASGFIDLFIEFLTSVKIPISESTAVNGLLKEQMILMMTLAKKLKVLIKEVNAELTFRTLEKVFIQLINRSEISLKGEPLSGIQVMGMLETRNLDFKNLIILSVNDGILPKSENIESFIPFDIRRYFKLPLPKDKTDIYAYHFYRLLQRAKKINLLYNSEPDAFGGGEKSRFILQLEEELAKSNTSLKPKASTIKVPLGKSGERQLISISKSDEVIELIKNRLQKSLSPTALTSFITCPLKFYFQYITNLKPAETLENKIEANILGQVIHGVLEDLLKDSCGKTIDIQKLRIDDELISEKVRAKFQSEFKGGNLDSGQNLLIVEVANQYIKKYLKAEINDLNKRGRIMVAAEERLEFKSEISGYEVNLKGFVDRTDKPVDGDTIRILDYKTGAVKHTDLQVKNWEDLTANPDKAKAFQVMFYAYLYVKIKKVTEEIEAGIISMRNISNGFIKLQLPEKISIQDGVPIFEEQLQSLINQIIDPGKDFYQTNDEKRCSFCDYINICNRNIKSNF